MSLEVLDVTIGRVLYHKPSPYSSAGLLFLIARTSDGRTIKGTMRKPVEGHAYRLWGAWRQQKPWKDNPPEDAFEFVHHEPLIRQCDDGIVEFLSGHIDGIGWVKAGALVAAFGPDTLTVLRQEPERASVEVKGISEANVAAIKDYFENELKFDPAAYARLVELFHQAAVRVSRKNVMKLLEFWRSDAPQVIVDQPYKLLALPGMGWKTVDTFAMSPAVGYDHRGGARQRAAILEALERISDEGHTHANKVDIEEKVFGLLGYLPGNDAWEELYDRSLIEQNEDPATQAETWSLPWLAEAEESIAVRLRTLANRASPLKFDLTSDRLHPDQQAALRIIQDYGVAALVGPPGTGKTFTVSALVECLRENGIRRILFVAPTGKAAKRGKELLPPGVPCSTIHKALGVTPSAEDLGVPSEDARVNRGREGFTFIHGLLEPLEVSYLIVDECFPAGTLVDTDKGPRDISTIRPGQRIRNAVGDDTVVGIYEREVHGAVTINAGGKEIVASQNHRFFTARGLVLARDLESGDSLVETTEAMRLLRHHNFDSLPRHSTLLQEVLRAEMALPFHGYQAANYDSGEKSEVRRSEEGLVRVGQPESRTGETTHCHTESDGATRGESQNFRGSQIHQSSPFRSGREWEGSDQSGIRTDGGASRISSARHCHSDGPGFRLSYELQTRPGQSGADDLHRTGRSLSSQRISEGARSEENGVPGFARVDRVEVLEPGDPRLDQFRDADGKLYFYDLQSARHQSFSVYGLLVHNCSMVSAGLMASLLEAVPPGARVLFVGDQNQLPSVGPGSVLRDMLDAGIPTAMLTRIVRSDGGGRVVRACHAIKDGQVPEPAAPPPQLPTENWCHIEASDPAAIAEIVAGLCRPYASFPDPVWDIQVISAQHERPGFGCRNLNRLLSRKLNSGYWASQETVAATGTRGDGGGGGESGEIDDESGLIEPLFVPGDKVIRRKNGPADEAVLVDEESDRQPPQRIDWTWRDQSYSFVPTALVNGDMGTVEDVIQGGERQTWVVVRFRNPHRLCRLAYGECHLQRAYAITVHSAQGSGFPMVVVPVHASHYWDARTGTGIWCRELIYTAISRAEKVLITVGNFEAIRMAIGRRTIGKRRTRLKELIEATSVPTRKLMEV